MPPLPPITTISHCLSRFCLSLLSRKSRCIRKFPYFCLAWSGFIFVKQYKLILPAHLLGFVSSWVSIVHDLSLYHLPHADTITPCKKYFLNLQSKIPTYFITVSWTGQASQKHLYWLQRAKTKIVFFFFFDVLQYKILNK